MNEPNVPRRPPGDLAFAAAFLVLSLLLLSQIGEQTAWAKRTRLFAQPRFWPAVGLSLMVGFGAFHLRAAWRELRKRPRLERWKKERRELIRWARALEFPAWFMAYVYAVPVAGYLACTLVFLPALVWRMGYRSRVFLWSAVATALGVVVLFKTALGVKIPGGAVYELLPDALRNLMIVYF